MWIIYLKADYKISVSKLLQIVKKDQEMECFGKNCKEEAVSEVFRELEKNNVNVKNIWIYIHRTKFKKVIMRCM